MKRYFVVPFLFFPFSVLAQAPTLETTVPTLLLSLIFVVFLIFVIAAIVKRSNLSTLGVSGLKVVTMLPLSTREKLVVVDVEGEQLLLGVTQNSINLIKQLDQPLAQKEKVNVGEGFKKILEQVKNRD